MQEYYIIHKPYGMLSQFTKEHPDHQTLGELHPFSKDIYPVGRLDKDSEGLLILTNNGKLNHQLLDPKNRHRRTYWAQVEGIPTEENLEKLKSGVEIKLKKGFYKTKPIEVQILDEKIIIEERNPPIRKRKNKPTSWLELTLKEGKNRQVRKMCAKIGFPVLRLIRVHIENLKLANLKVGEVKKVEEETLKKLLNLS